MNTIREVTHGLVRHPLSAAWPDIDDVALAELRKDIEENGQRRPVVVVNGKQVIDGWQRARACQFGDPIPIKVVDYPKSLEDAYRFIVSEHTRRNVTSAERALAVAKSRAWLETGTNQHTKAAKEGMQTVHTLPPASTKQMAEEAGVSTRQMAYAKAAVKNGRDDEVVGGKVGLAQAAKKPDAPEKPKAPSPIEKIQAENKALREQLNSLQARQQELTAELEAAFAAVDSEDEQLIKFQELTRRTQTLSLLLDQEKEKSTGFLQENKWLRSELKKYGWEG